MAYDGPGYDGGYGRGYGRGYGGGGEWRREPPPWQPYRGESYPPAPARPAGGRPGGGPPGVGAGPEPPAPPPTRWQRLPRWLQVAAVALLAVQIMVAGCIVSMRWWTPGRTAFMIENGAPTAYEYVSLDHVSRLLIAAVIAHEDENLGPRRGPVSLRDFRDRITAYLQGREDPSGSTIPQQLAKNVFLWPGQDPVRKGVEAALATEMTLAMTDRRLVELYVNYAQFGPHLFGICAASWYYFGEPPWNMTAYQSAQLMGVLPAPDRVTRAPGGGLDTSSRADPLAVNLINGAANVHVPRELAGMGGWQQAVATIGIHDTAQDHAAQRDEPDACSAMPASVAARLGGG